MVTIKVSLETRKRLKNFGTSGDTADTTINKALDCLKFLKARGEAVWTA